MISLHIYAKKSHFGAKIFFSKFFWLGSGLGLGLGLGSKCIQNMISLHIYAKKSQFGAKIFFRNFFG